MAITQVKTPGIADDAVTLAKQAGGTDGQIITYDASGNPTAVGPGTDGQVLTSTGAGSPPAFENNYVHPNHSGEVTSTADGATVIASNIVDEDNLKISNAGSNGQYLQKQSGNTGGLTWADVSATDTLSFRNLIINGAFNVAQRGTSSTSALYQTVDRFKYGFTGTDEAPTQAQHALTSGDTGPWAKGFRYSYHLTNGNQTSGAGAADIIYLYHFIEAQDIASSGWDYTNASSKITLSFWIKSSVAQNFYGFVKTMDGTAQLLTFQTTALSANTWEKVTVVIPGHANLQFDNNNDSGLQIAWMPFFGTDYTTSGKTLNAWAAYSGSDRSPDNTSTWYTTNDSTFEITGVQLEVGEAATEFEHRSYGEELARCQRYYYKSDMFHSACMTYTPGSGDHQFTRMNTDHPVTMRANPSGIAGDFACWSWSSATGVAAANLTWTFDNGTNNSMMTMTASHSNAAAPANGPGSGHMVPCRVLNIEFSSEL
tara:strand:+ start:666 stop:2117 length:1452 start_codon:yes stop_codon:yes gene_type:complete